MTHFLKHDFRIESLNQIIYGLNNAIGSLKTRMEEYEWYDSLCFLEDSEPIYGLAFVAFQNYINSTIKDITGNLSEKTKYYAYAPKFRNYEKSEIELIVGLANYSKHKEDDGEFHKGTSEILKSFNLNTSKEEITSSPIFEGLSILNDNWNLIDISLMVTNWRKNLFNSVWKE